MNPVQRFINFISHPDHKRTFSILAALAILVSIPLTVYVAQQRQEIRQRADEPKGCECVDGQWKDDGSGACSVQGVEQNSCKEDNENKEDKEKKEKEDKEKKEKDKKDEAPPSLCDVDPSLSECQPTETPTPPTASPATPTTTPPPENTPIPTPITSPTLTPSSTLTPTGNITASPNPCNIPAGSTTCSNVAIAYTFSNIDPSKGVTLCQDNISKPIDVSGSTYNATNLPVIRYNYVFKLVTPSWDCTYGAILDSETVVVNPPASDGIPTPTTIISSNPPPAGGATPAPTKITTTVSSNPDVDRNKCVGIADFSLWLYSFQNNGKIITSTFPDIDSDIDITILDFNIWLNTMRSGQNLCAAR
ncbi:MAG: hypothetical protein Q7S38_00635 [bacterium]|nr:hypothetical protein [bacterium]